MTMQHPQTITAVADAGAVGVAGPPQPPAIAAGVNSWAQVAGVPLAVDTSASQVPAPLGLQPGFPRTGSATQMQDMASPGTPQAPLASQNWGNMQATPTAAPGSVQMLPGMQMPAGSELDALQAPGNTSVDPSTAAAVSHQPLADPQLDAPLEGFAESLPPAGDSSQSLPDSQAPYPGNPQDIDAPLRDDHPVGDNGEGHQPCEAFTDALKRFELYGIEVVEQVELKIIGRTDKKMNVKFDFDTRHDTPLLIAREMLEENLAPAVSGVEELTILIERAVIERCQKMTYSNPNFEAGPGAHRDLRRQDSTGLSTWSEINAEPLSTTGHSEAATPSVSQSPEAVLIRELSGQKHVQLSAEICVDKGEDPIYQKEVRP